MIRRAVFVAGIAKNGEKQLWERDLEFWAKGLNSASFDSIVACVLNGKLAFEPDGVAVHDAHHDTITKAINDCAAGLTADDELWLVISNHGDDLAAGPSGFSTATPKKLFSLFDMNKAIDSSPAQQVVIAGQCGAGHFCVKPPSNRVVLAACGYMQFAGRITGEATHNEWLQLVGLALFPSVALANLSPRETSWRQAATQSNGSRSLETAFEFANTHTQTMNPRRYPTPQAGSPTTQTQKPQLAGRELAARIYL